MTIEIDKEKEATSLFAKLYEDSASHAAIKEGQIVKGTVVALRRGEALVDINYKSEGALPLDEFPKPAEVRVGDQVDVLFESVEDENGMVVLSKRKADRQKCWDTLLSNANEGGVVEGRIFKKVRGGFMVDVGMEAFLPASLVDLKPIKNLDQFVGQVSKFMIVKINDKRKNIVVSRKDYLEKERAHIREQFLGSLKLNEIVRGRVKNITDFGAFIDLGEVDGLLHITDMSWGRVSHPSEILSLGDEIEVAVIGIDCKNGKVSLGLKQTTASPWETVEEKFPPGTRLQGRVTNLLPYGAFVELEKGVEGLIHISEFSWTKRINHPSEILKSGDRIEVMVLSVDKTAHKLSLGLKQLEDSPWKGIDERFHSGDIVEGIVRNVTDYGIFVELEPGIDGLVHVSDLSWTKKYASPSDLAKKGDKFKAKLLELDVKGHKVSLGLKQMENDPWPDLTRSLKVESLVPGKVTKVVNFGLFVELESGLEGLVHISEIPNQIVPRRLEDAFQPGQSVHVTILNVDFEARKIALSLKTRQ